uniref:Uncharacterized protein n=1 Tax=Timema bartmani TaxID=61472 RepID=A0A7R9HWS5_9NEOP|nr:unnamed protein product [Timema bartmani]
MDEILEFVEKSTQKILADNRLKSVAASTFYYNRNMKIPLRQLGDGPTKPPLKLLAGYGLN